MALVSICSSMFYKNQILPTKLSRQSQRGVLDDCITVQKVCRCSCSSIAGDVGRRFYLLHHTSKLCMNAKTRQGDKPMPFQVVTEIFSPYKVYGIGGPVKSSLRKALQRDELCTEYYASETNTNSRQLKALDSYFSKLHNEENGQQTSFMPTSDYETVPDTEEYQTKSSSQVKTKDELGSLDNYFGKLTPGLQRQKNKLPTKDEGTTERNHTVSGGLSESREETINKLNSFMSLEGKDDESGPLIFGDENLQDLQPYDEASDFYLIILASINIAVFLFEIASPVRNTDVENLSLPLMYGAKINELILGGEWWRLVTPMFLHSGFLHVALGCWVLLTFGPQVCRGYGSFTFFLIYILGGIAGNLSSFVHTPELTVGGTGPVFAILGAWFIYQIQSKVMISKEESESMFQKVLITTALSFVLSNFERIDDWTHLGAACAGLAYGFLTLSPLELNNASANNGQEEGIALIRRRRDPCKSLITFAIFILILSSLFFLFEPQLNTLELDSFV
ncbi:rhomboid-related intramembrane serine protease family protein isoform X2 [Tasmannia lanceolata]|uniref:rhomboid-related intramembrane serine protease family protein isoform X2 n=1 Tax=Tasmannia lanceolata TaxID=3420 RepID=UPI004064AE0E